jgi:hypothetical protein
MIYPYQQPLTSKAWLGAPGSCFESRKPKTLEVPEATTSHGFTWQDMAEMAVCGLRDGETCHMPPLTCFATHRAHAASMDASSRSEAHVSNPSEPTVLAPLRVHQDI